MVKKTHFVYLSAILLTIGCARTDRVFKAESYTLGTYVQLEMFTNNASAHSFLKDFNALSEQQTQDLYAWGQGELASINQHLKQAKCTPLPVSADMLTLLIKSKEISTQSSHFFMPTIKPLVELWGFHRAEEMRSEPPNDNDIQVTLNHFGNMQDLEIHANTVCAKKPIELDLGAIAKGWAAHTTARQLHAKNIKHALIGFGGDLIALGKKADGSAWKVGLRNPNIDWEGFDAPAVFTIDSSKLTAIFTSGDYERQFEHKGKRSHHILDPRTGYPNTDVHSVTVIHSDPILADAAATALHVAGNNWRTLAQQMELDKVLVLFPEKQAQITRKMAAMTNWLDSEYSVTIVE